MIKIKRTIVITFFIIALFRYSAYSARIHPDAGTTAAAFLKIDAGARPAAMAGAFSAIADDSNALFWNPAGLAHINYSEMTAMYSRWFQNINYGFISYIRPLGENAGIGAGIVGLRIADDIEYRSGKGEVGIGGVIVPETPLTEIGGRFGAYDIAGFLSYGRKLNSKFAVGGSFKFIQQAIYEYRATGWAVDLGMLWQVNNKLNLAFNINNIGPRLKFIERGYKLPLNFKLGVASRITENIILSVDIDQPIDNFALFRLGMEYDLVRFVWPAAKKEGKLTLRSGYKWRLFGNPFEKLSGVTAGIGIGMGDFSLDYTLAPYGFLGYTHRIALTVGFETGRAKEKPVNIPEKIELEKAEEIEIEEEKIKLDWHPLIISTPDRMLWLLTIDSPTPMLNYINIKTRQGPSDNIRVSVKEIELSEEIIISTEAVNLIEFSFEHNLNINVFHGGEIVFMVLRSRVAEYGLSAGDVRVAEYSEGNWNEVKVEELHQDEMFYVYRVSVAALNKILVFGEK